MPGARSSVFQLCTTLLVAGALAACNLNGVATRGRTPSVRPTTPTVGIIGQDGTSIVGDAGASIVGDAGASLISNNGGALTGKVKVPTGIIANNSGSLISDHGAAVISNNAGGIVSNNAGGLTGKTKLALLAVEEAPLSGVTLTLVDAGGTPFKDAKGQPFQTKTDATGAYTFAHTPRGANLVLRADLPASVGPMVAFVPDAAPESAREVNVDGTSTLVMGYVLDEYVRSQSNPRDVLAKLPAGVEADTRAKADVALGDHWSATSFQPAAVKAAVEGLRGANHAFDAQVDYVKSLLVAGLKDLGDGQAQSAVALNSPSGTARLKDGSLLVVERNGDRIRRIWPDGHLTTFAGKPGTRELGDGGPAVEASLDRPASIDVDANDNVYIADFGHRVIRRVDGKTSVITTVIGSGASPDGHPGEFPADGQMAAEAILNTPVQVLRETTGAFVLKCGNGQYHVGTDGKLAAIQHPSQSDAADGYALGPDGTIYAYNHVDGRISTVVDNQCVPLERVPAHSELGESSLAVGPDGQFYLGGFSALWRFDGKAWSELPFAPRHETFKALRVEGDSLIVPDSGTNRVWKVPLAGGAATQIAGLPPQARDAVPAEALGLSRPSAVVFDRAGNLLLIDSQNGVIWQRRADGLYYRFAGNPDAPPGTPDGEGGPAKNAIIGRILTLAALPDGRVIFVDGSFELGAHMRSVSPDGILTTISFPENVVVPVALAPTLTGGLFVSDLVQGVIFEQKGEETTALNDMNDLKQAAGIVADPAGGCYVSDVKQHAVYHVANGTLTRIAGGLEEGFSGDGGPALDAQLNYPLGLALDAVGRLYVADTRNDRVRRIDPKTGIITTVVGAGGLALDGTTPDDSIKEPAGLAFAPNGDLYLADSGHNQVKAVKRDVLGN